MNYLLDTNIISEVRKGPRCNPDVAAWYSLIEDSEIYLGVLVLGEIRKGLERPRRNNPGRVQSLTNWLTAISRSFAQRILPIDQAITDEWGRIRAKRPVSTIDALLAATAKVNDMTRAILWTSPILVLNPFEARNGH